MAIRHDRKVSILDVMGPVMVGPSSSHTAGTARLGRVAHEILDEDPVDVKFFLHPPLAATYRGHGSDFALVGGAIGLNVDDPRIPEALRIAEQMGVEVALSSKSSRSTDFKHGSKVTRRPCCSSIATVRA